MEGLERYRDAAWSSREFSFVAQYPSPVLLKRPLVATASGQVRTVEFSYQTSITVMRGDPFPADWLVYRVTKRDGSPYPDRISIGRAPNCDVVVRVPAVSKLHAHLLRDPDGHFRLVDLGSTGGTRLNGLPLEVQKPSALRFGDKVSFGGFPLEFLDAKGFYRVLTTDYRE